MNGNTKHTRSCVRETRINLWRIGSTMRDQFVLLLYTHKHTHTILTHLIFIYRFVIHLCRHRRRTPTCRVYIYACPHIYRQQQQLDMLCIFKHTHSIAVHFACVVCCLLHDKLIFSVVSQCKSNDIEEMSRVGVHWGRFFERRENSWKNLAGRG